MGFAKGQRCLPAHAGDLTSEGVTQGLAGHANLLRSILQTSLKDPFRVQNKHGFNSWNLGASER